MRASTMVVCVVAMFLVIVGIALIKKSTVKASGNIGMGSFAIEASDK